MTHTFSKTQVLNITTGKLHTTMDDIYHFFDTVIEKGIMTHNLPAALRAVTPILKEKLPIELFENAYKPDAEGEVSFDFTYEDKHRFWGLYNAQPSPFESRN